MEKTRKNLRDISIFVLVIAGLALIRLSIQTIFGNIFTVKTLPEIPEGMTEELAKTVMLVTQIAAWAISLVAILPQLFIGLRGLKNAKGPMDVHGHITWAKVMFVFSIIGTVSSFFTLFSSKDLFNDILSLLITAVDIFVFFLFIKYANQINSEAISE